MDWDYLVKMADEIKEIPYADIDNLNFLLNKNGSILRIIHKDTKIITIEEV